MVQPTADMRCDHQTKISKKFPLGWVANILLVFRFIRKLISKKIVYMFKTRTIWAKHLRQSTSFPSCGF